MVDKYLLKLREKLKQRSYMEKHEVESLAKDALENNPLSAHCERILEEPPECISFRGARAFAMCFAWKLMEDEKIGLSPALKRAWQEFRKVCHRE